MITIVLPISRKDYLDRVFHQLEILDAPKDTNILTYVDGHWDLYEKARNLTMNSKFKERLCVFRQSVTKRKSIPGTSSVFERRTRIANIHNEIKGLIKDADYLFLIEDDTLFTANTLRELMAAYSFHPFAGLISGIELGRWGYTMIGAWKFDDIYNPQEIVSIEYQRGRKLLEEVDATGFYCALTKAENYLKHDFQPFEKILGPDVNYGISLRRVGLKNYVSHQIRCTHLTKKDPIEFHNSEIVQVRFRKNPENKWGWEQDLVDK